MIYDHHHLKDIRLRLGESQHVFARRFGVAQSAIARWELGGIPSFGAASSLVQIVLGQAERELSAKQNLQTNEGEGGAVESHESAPECDGCIPTPLNLAPHGIFETGESQ